MAKRTRWVSRRYRSRNPCRPRSPNPSRLASARVEALAPFRAAAQRVATLAETNAALLAASAAAIADTLGVRTGVQTYDSRARLNQRMNMQCARVV